MKLAAITSRLMKTMVSDCAILQGMACWTTAEDADALETTIPQAYRSGIRRYRRHHLRAMAICTQDIHVILEEV